MGWYNQSTGGRGNASEKLQTEKGVIIFLKHIFSVNVREWICYLECDVLSIIPAIPAGRSYIPHVWRLFLVQGRWGG